MCSLNMYIKSLYIPETVRNDLPEEKGNLKVTSVQLWSGVLDKPGDKSMSEVQV